MFCFILQFPPTSQGWLSHCYQSRQWWHHCLGNIQKVLETCPYNQRYMKSLGCATIKICKEIMSFGGEERWEEVWTVEMTVIVYTVLRSEGHKAQKIFSKDRLGHFWHGVYLWESWIHKFFWLGFLLRMTYIKISTKTGKMFGKEVEKISSPENRGEGNLIMFLNCFFSFLLPQVLPDTPQTQLHVLSLF